MIFNHVANLILFYRDKHSISHEFDYVGTFPVSKSLAIISLVSMLWGQTNAQTPERLYEIISPCIYCPTRKSHNSTKDYFG